MARAGIDLGGTKIEAMAMGAKGEALASIRVATPRAYEETLSAIRSLVVELERRTGARIDSVGIGIPGSPSPKSGLIRNANSTWLNGCPLGADLANLLSRPVRLANDANCFALSEASDGAGAGAKSVFGVIIGTGCGGGLVIDAKLVEGAGAIAGEWGHTPLPWMRAEEYPGPLCWCGKMGCLETWISGTGFARDHQRTTGRDWRAEAIIEACKERDEAARAAYERLVDRMARGLSSVINIIDPDIIVLGGGLSNIAALGCDIEARLPAYVFSDAVTTRVVKNVHGDSSGVRGAAWLFAP
jgi:fructokinase